MPSFWQENRPQSNGAIKGSLTKKYFQMVVGSISIECRSFPELETMVNFSSFRSEEEKMLQFL